MASKRIERRILRALDARLLPALFVERALSELWRAGDDTAVTAFWRAITWARNRSSRPTPEDVCNRFRHELYALWMRTGLPEVSGI